MEKSNRCILNLSSCEISALVSIDDPALNIIGMIHPENICDFLDKEKIDSNDGMWGRFHICLPKPVFPLVEEVEAPDKYISSLER